MKYSTIAEAAAAYSSHMASSLPRSVPTGPVSRLLDTSFCVGAAAALAMVDDILGRAESGELSETQACAALVKLSSDLADDVEQARRGVEERLRKADPESFWDRWFKRRSPSGKESGAP